MKKLFSATETSTAISTVLLFARISIAALMLTHGIPKLGMLLSGEPVQFMSVMGMSPQVSLGLAVFAEVICSVLLLAGLGTRLAVIPLIVTMLVAVFIIHANDPFTAKEPGLQYLLVYFMLFILGAGRYSLDHFFQRNPGTVPVKAGRSSNSRNRH